MLTRSRTRLSLARWDLPNRAAVRYSVGEYVNGMAHTNWIESFWDMLKRGYHGTYHPLQRQTPPPLHS